ncbi:MAG: hypothetical protein LBU18_06560 [Treponema sp.]|nr:hypothetical protein [Treponema sp.]
MFGKVKRGLAGILAALGFFMIMGCDTPLSTKTGNSEIVITSRAVGDTLVSFTQNGVTFVVVQTAGNIITLTMINSQGTATVNYTVRTYTFAGNLSNEVTKTNTLYQSVYQKEPFYFPTLGTMTITINSITR